jgi:hypothetical protein
MRKLLLAAIAGSLAALALPAGALAHHHGARHALRHHRHHRHALVHILDFRAAAAPMTTTSPTTPATTPQPPTPETAGTVATFSNGVLTLKLNDGTLVSGKVTENTEIQCTSASQQGNNDGHGDEMSTRAHESWAHSGQQGSQADDGQQGAQGQEGNDQGDQDDNEGGCPANPLTEGAKVLDAELEIGPAGAVWERVDLLQ